MDYQTFFLQHKKLIPSFAQSSFVLFKECALTIAVLFLATLSLNTNASSSDVFAAKQEAVYQVRIIDIGSDNKSVIGSGFLVKDSGLIATNYHVVSSYIELPNDYKIQVFDKNGNIHAAELVNFDVIHDLALLKPVTTDTLAFSSGKGLDLNTRLAVKGEKIYSMGNPLDLGMTIIEGIYNGHVENSRYKNMLFSGSLNSGMSGGPSLDTQGRVVGINVSKANDEQISFLVPVKHLQTLLTKSTKKLMPSDYKTQTTKDLYADQQLFYSKLLSKPWKTKAFASFILPDEINESLRCWGHTQDKEDEKLLYDGVHRYCSSNDSIYIDNDMSTGQLSYRYSYFSSHGLEALRFYNKLQSSYSMSDDSYASQDSGTDYSCKNNFLNLNSTTFKASICSLEYLDYPGLYDAALILMQVDDNQSSLVVNLFVSGIDKNNLKQLHQRFLGQISWKK